MRLRTTTLAFAILLLCGFFAGTSANASQANCKVVMGWEPWPPLQYLDENQQLTGLDVEIMRAVFSAMPCQLVYRAGNWTRSLYEVRTGSMDALSAADRTAKRDQWARFSDPYRDDSMAIYTLKGAAKKFPLKSLDDIVRLKFRLGVLRGVNYGSAFAKHAQDPTFKKQLYYLDAPIMQRYKILKANRIDGFTYPSSAAKELDEQTGGDVERLGFLIHSAKQHVMFSRESVSQEVVDQFNASLKLIRKNGLYDKIVSKYKNR